MARKDFAGDAVSYYFSDLIGTASVIANADHAIEDEDFYPQKSYKLLTNL